MNVDSTVAGNNNSLWFHNNGNIGIGTSTPTTKLEISGDVTATAYYYSSDRRLKSNIRALDNSLEKIIQLNGYSFDWNATGKKDIGVIAQEVEAVFPEAVRTNPITGMKAVEYGNLVAPLIEALKTQQHQIDTQSLQIQELQKKISQLQK
jgi:trimeric autotransporter adhesin